MFRSLFKLLFLCIILLFSSPSKSQNEYEEIKSDIFSLMKDNSTFKSRQTTRKFFRILNSNNLTKKNRSDIYTVLDEFDLRRLSFNNHYVKFFNLFLFCHESDQNQFVFNNVLDFLIENKSIYTNIQLKYLFFDIDQFLKSNVLNIANNFTWKCVGDFNFMFEVDGNPFYKFSNAELSLFNGRDTISIFNIIGRYDILENVFYGESGASNVCDDDICIDFTFNNFILNLNRRFFDIANTSMSSIGLVNTTCLGVYSNKLTSSETYPVFQSYLDTINAKIFNRFTITSSIQTQGLDFFFNRKFNPIEFRFNDDEIEYMFSSNNFQLKNSQINSSQAVFSFGNKLGSISHPSVNFSYDDIEQKIFIERLSGKRGLNPILNTFHGLNIFVDKLEIDLVDDNCLFFHYSRGRDVSVLFESDNYFDQDRYRDIAGIESNPLSLLLDFCEEKNDNNFYMLKDFSQFLGLNLSDALNVLLELEIFGFIDYDAFTQLFQVKSWAFGFFESYLGSYDYDSFRIESFADVGDTVAEIDLYLNTMDIYKVQKMKITNRFSFNIYPISNKLRFFKDKSFFIDGNIDIGSFAFSGANIMFDYNDFAFHFSNNSILSFLNDNKNDISSSLIYFDAGVLYVDTVKNRSGKKVLNDFPKFKMHAPSFLSYDNNPVMFLIQPFELKYLHDMSLSNISFPGNLYLNGEKSNLFSVLSFNKTNNLEGFIYTDSVDLYHGSVNFGGELFLSEKGLFASGSFSSNYLNFFSNKIELLSGQIIGQTESVYNGDALMNTSFVSNNPSLINFSPYDNKFLLKSIDNKFLMYNKFTFLGDLYFDAENLNGSGLLESNLFSVNSSHHYYSENDIVAADARLVVNNRIKNQEYQFVAEGVSVEYDLLDDSIFLLKNTNKFQLPYIDYMLDFDFVFFDLEELVLDFGNHNISDLGYLTSFRYGKKNIFSYKALNVSYDLIGNELCVEDGIQLEIKKFWIQPSENKFCVLDNGDFPVFENSTLIKKRWLLKDKLINNVDVIIQPNLKHLIIAN